MAAVLKNFKFPQLEAKLPWDKWLDGRIWQLTQGVDFKIKLDSFQQKAFQVAGKKGGKLRTNIRGNSVVLQFTPKSGRKGKSQG